MFWILNKHLNLIVLFQSCQALCKFCIYVEKWTQTLLCHYKGMFKKVKLLLLVLTPPIGEYSGKYLFMGGEYDLGESLYPKKCQSWNFYKKYANFEIFSPQLCKFWQFLPKNSQILTIFAKKGGKTGKGVKKLSFFKWGPGNNISYLQNIHLCWKDING